MTDQAKIAIVVVAKAPVVGKVKTRLCPPLTFSQSATLYKGFLQDTIDIALQIQDSSVKIVCPSEFDATELQKFISPQVSYIVQPGSGLSDALTTSYVQCLEQGYKKVFCISSDNPTLPLAYLSEAVQKLDQAEVVLGPSEDGGYYLIGAKALYPALFENIDWSTSRVLEQTLNCTNEAGLETALLPLWYDLDTDRELSRFVKELSNDPGGANYTREALKAIDIDIFS